VIVGRQDLIEQLSENPLMRTYRVGKLTLLALEATLRAYVDVDEAFTQIPTLALLAASTDELAKRAGLLSEQLSTAMPEEDFLVCSDVSFAGGGSLPTHELETVVVQWRPSQISADSMAAALRESDVPVVARIRDDAICFDLRTLREADFEALVASVSSAMWDDKAAPQDDEGGD
jgi:L-seryl-tRNA(Ser) seleniumtransferase